MLGNDDDGPLARARPLELALNGVELDTGPRGPGAVVVRHDVENASKRAREGDRVD